MTSLKQAVANFSLMKRKEIIIGDNVIPSNMIASKACDLDISEDLTKIESQAGTLQYPNGSFEFTITLHFNVPNVAFLQSLFPDLYKTATYDKQAGSISWGTDMVSNLDPVPVVLRNANAEDSTQDIYIPAALLSIDGGFSFEDGKATTVDINVTAIDNGDGAIHMGCGSLVMPTLFDPDKGMYVENVTTDDLTTSPETVTPCDENGNTLQTMTGALNTPLNIYGLLSYASGVTRVTGSTQLISLSGDNATINGNTVTYTTAGVYTLTITSMQNSEATATITVNIQ